jgi:hypothetical protein
MSRTARIIRQKEEVKLSPNTADHCILQNILSGKEQSINIALFAQPRWRLDPILAAICTPDDL